MREIKFRIFNKHTKGMIYDTQMAMRNMFENDFSTEDEHRYLMQFTGLYDKNGCEIYEGDILSDHGDEGPLHVEYSKEHAGFVFIDEFDYSGRTHYTPMQISYEQFEVIGNVYEDKHKHLLEGASE